MINFMLPGVYERFHVNKAFILLKRDHPDWFRPDVDFGACYGTFQLSIWDGGRSYFQNYQQATYEKIIEVKKFFEEQNIPLRLIYTNPIVEEKHLSDHFCNLVTSLCESSNNELVVNSEILEKYLREKYPLYKFISSTTKCKINQDDALSELSKNYYLVCLDYNLNKNQDFLNKISDDLKPKVEILVNAICPPGCPNRKKHYLLNGMEHLNYGKFYTVPCLIDGSTVSNKTHHYHNNLTPDEIYLNYVSQGFSNFKLEGRTLPDLELISNYVYYMIKPEYYFEALNEIMYFAKLYFNDFNKL